MAENIEPVLTLTAYRELAAVLTTFRFKIFRLFGGGKRKSCSWKRKVRIHLLNICVGTAISNHQPFMQIIPVSNPPRYAPPTMIRSSPMQFRYPFHIHPSPSHSHFKPSASQATAAQPAHHPSQQTLHSSPLFQTPYYL